MAWLWQVQSTLPQRVNTLACSQKQPQKQPAVVVLPGGTARQHLAVLPACQHSLTVIKPESLTVHACNQGLGKRSGLNF